MPRIIIFLVFLSMANNAQMELVSQIAEPTTNIVPFPNSANETEDIYLRFYNGSTFEEYVEVPLANALELLTTQNFDKTNSTVLYSHGYIETPQSESVQVMVSAYLQGKPDTNMILLDWSKLAKGLYTNAASNTKTVGTAAAEKVNKLLEGGLSLETLHLIGHSLGGHTVGYLARELKNNYGRIVKRVTGLDPAFPEFYPDGSLLPPSLVLQHIGAIDAAFVDIIHTDGGKYGAPVRTGTADFWPNGGKATQPGCPSFALIPLSPDSLCNHWQSWRLYAETVLQSDAFPASPADSYLKFKNNPAPEQGLVYMGINCDPSASGSYFLVTNASSPYGKGMDGLYA